MPGRDTTGPAGTGTLTGRGLGPCTGNRLKYAAAGAGIGPGFGLGPGLGRRRGFRGGFGRGRYAGSYAAGKTRKEQLLEQKDLLTLRLDAIERQLKDL